MFEFVAAHPFIAAGLLVAGGLAASFVVAAPFNAWAKIRIASSRRTGACPRCNGSGWDPDELEKLARGRR